MRKYRLHNPEIIEIIINEMVSKYNIDINYLKSLSDGKIEDKYWFEYYTFDSEEDYIKWKDFTLDFLSKNITPKLNKTKAIKFFNAVDLMWGLKRNY